MNPSNRTYKIKLLLFLMNLAHKLNKNIYAYNII